MFFKTHFTSLILGLIAIISVTSQLYNFFLVEVTTTSSLNSTFEKKITELNNTIRDFKKSSEIPSGRFKEKVSTEFSDWRRRYDRRYDDKLKNNELKELVCNVLTWPINNVFTIIKTAVLLFIAVKCYQNWTTIISAYSRVVAFLGNEKTWQWATNLFNKINEITT